MLSRSVIAAMLFLAGAAAPALANPEPAAAGRVKVASGAAVIVRGGTTLPATVGAYVLESDSLRTGPDGRIGLTLKDDTRVSLGPDSEVRVDSFRYAPGEGRLALALQFVRGVAGYISGRIAKLAPNAVKLETPAAIVGVRGTSLAIRVSQ
jgi:hypothetical protein